MADPLSFCDSEQDVVEIAANIDDMTGEHLSAALSALMSAGALDVSAVPALMKKGRQGFVLTVLAHPADAERLGAEVLRITTTAGVRFRLCGRLVQSVSFQTVETDYGPVSVKCYEGYGQKRFKPESDRLRGIAAETGLPFDVLSQMVLKKLNG